MFELDANNRRLGHPSKFASINDDDCHRFRGALELVGRRWNSAVLLALARGSERFVDIRGAVLGLSDRMLAVRLKELQKAGLVARDIIASTPVQVRYSLTPRGASLLKAMEPLIAWEQAADED